MALVSSCDAQAITTLPWTQSECRALIASLCIEYNSLYIRFYDNRGM